MKNNDIQTLLERYREGTLSDSELDELNRLAGRDEVMASAGRQADSILRRRRTIVYTLAGLLVAGGFLWTLIPRQETPLVAEATVPEAIVEPIVEQVAPAASTTVAPTPTHHVRHTPEPRTVAKAVHTAPTIVEMPAEEPVVICNNQCEADSVISDIWKFLTV